MKRIKIKALRYHEFIEYEMNGPTQDFFIGESYKLTENQREYWFMTKDKSFVDRFNRKENWVHTNFINGWYIGFLKNATINGVDFMSMEQLRPKIESIIKGQYVVFFNVDHRIIHVDRLIGIHGGAYQYVRVNCTAWLDGDDYKSIEICESDPSSYMVFQPGDLVHETQHLYVIDNEFGKVLYDARMSEILGIINDLTSKPCYSDGYQIESPDGELMVFRDILDRFKYLDQKNIIDQYLIADKSDHEGWESVITRLFYIQKLLPKEVIQELRDSGYKLIKVRAERMDCKYMVGEYLINSLVSLDELNWSALDEEIPY